MTSNDFNLEYISASTVLYSWLYPDKKLQWIMKRKLIVSYKKFSFIMEDIFILSLIKMYNSILNNDWYFCLWYINKSIYNLGYFWINLISLNDEINGLKEKRNPIATMTRWFY